MPLGTELDRSTLRSLGGVLVRGLVRMVEGRGQTIPAAHALAIVISAAARVQAAHASGARLYATVDNVLVRYDGTVEIRPSRWPAGSDPHADVHALGRVLVQLLRDDNLSGDAMAAIAAAIDHDRGAATPAELARVLVQIARDAELTLTAHELGRYARHQVYPRSLDTPVDGIPTGSLMGEDSDVISVEDVPPRVVPADVAVEVDSGWDDAPIEAHVEAAIDAPAPRLARGSAFELRGEEPPARRKRPTEMDFDKMMKRAAEVQAPPVIEPRRVARVGRGSSISPVQLPAASGTVAGEAPRSPARWFVYALALLMILGAAGFVVYAAYPEAFDALLHR